MVFSVEDTSLTVLCLCKRWSYEGLSYLRDNRVIVFCLPSHTTIWAQPNDASANKEMHRAISEVTKEWQRANIFNKKLMKLADWNVCYVEFWRTFVDNQHHLRQETGNNHVTDGWQKVGLSTGDIANSEHWLEAIATLGCVEDVGVITGTSSNSSSSSSSSSASPCPTAESENGDSYSTPHTVHEHPAKKQFRLLKDAHQNMIRAALPTKRVDLRKLTTAERSVSAPLKKNVT